MAEAKEYDDAYCLAHTHAAREEEAICSLRFQLEGSRRDAAEMREALEAEIAEQERKSSEQAFNEKFKHHYCAKVLRAILNTWEE
jgi:protein involved in ribonucleotide reduction